MKHINEVIVVEGQNDSKRLKSFFDVETIETHGLGLTKETLKFINEINNRRGVILLLDPDIPGEKIRKRINDTIPGLKNAFILKQDACTSKKVGVEHASEKVLSEALSNIISYNSKIVSLTIQDLNDMGLNGKESSSKLREIVSKEFHIGKCNVKTMLKRLNMLQINKEDIYDCLNNSR